MRLAAAAALAAAAVAGGCGGGGDAPESSRFTARALQTADCTDWKRIDLRERRAVIDQLEQIARGPHDKGTTLPDDAAYDAIDNRCGQDFARGFLLYEMYNRAASFYLLTGRGDG